MKKEHGYTALIVLLVLVLFTYVIAPQIDKAMSANAPAPLADAAV